MDGQNTYRGEAQQLVDWYSPNNLTLNVAKMKKMVVDFRKTRKEHLPLFIGSSMVERVRGTKFLGGHLTEDLSWDSHITALPKRHTHASTSCNRPLPWHYLEFTDKLHLCMVWIMQLCGPHCCGVGHKNS